MKNKDGLTLYYIKTDTMYCGTDHYYREFFESKYNAESIAEDKAYENWCEYKQGDDEEDELIEEDEGACYSGECEVYDPDIHDLDFHLTAEEKFKDII